MKLEDRIKAIAELGFSERQARFLDLVMASGGLCVPRQYATFAGTAYGHAVSRFFDKLVRRGYAAVCDCLHNRAELYHLRHRALYRAIDQPHSRYRRPVPARQVLDRLTRLDAVVLQPELIWLATEEEKVAFFSLMAPSLPRERLPHVIVGKGAGRRLRLFPEDQPIGVTTTGRVVFSYLVTAYETEGLRVFVQRHADLLRVLPGWTLRLVLPQQLADTRARFEGVVRDELTPLRPELLAELKWYFAKRRSTPSPRTLSLEDPEFWEDQAAFSSPRFQQLYLRWLTDGDTVFEALASPAITEALQRGTGKIESRILLLSYRHLAPLVSLFRSCRKGSRAGTHRPHRLNPLVLHASRRLPTPWVADRTPPPARKRTVTSTTCTRIRTRNWGGVLCRPDHHRAQYTAGTQTCTTAVGAARDVFGAVQGSFTSVCRRRNDEPGFQRANERVSEAAHACRSRHECA